MSNVPDSTDNQVFAKLESSINKPVPLNFDPVGLLRDAGQGQQLTEQVGTDYGFPKLSFGESETADGSLDKSLGKSADSADLADATELTSFIASDDFPPTRIDQRLDGAVEVREPAQPGNAHQIVDLIAGGNFQNPDFSITLAGIEAIRAAVGSTGFFQTYEGRAQEVEDYVNQHLIGNGISITFDRDRANARTALGSRPAVVVNLPGVRETRIPMHR